MADDNLSFTFYNVWYRIANDILVLVYFVDDTPKRADSWLFVLTYIDGIRK